MTDNQRVKRAIILAGLLCTGGSEMALAQDLAEALKFASSVMGEEAIVGYEDFVDHDPTEALSLLLARDVKVNRPDRELAPEVFNIHPGRKEHFESLGNTRLGFEQLKPHILQASKATGLPVALIDAVIRTESGYRPHAVSQAGARGLMQLMPGTAYEVGVQDAFDPQQNIMGGAKYLRKLYNQFGSIEIAVAAYNAGPGAVARHGGIPPFPETKQYVKVVMERYRTSSVR